MTKKLFWEDAYQTTCKSKVTEINGKSIKVDQTVFFAFSGGQASDEGTIGGIKVVNAEKIGDKEDIIDISYELEKEPDFKIGDEVDIIVDGDGRDKLRKLHTAIHVAYYLIEEKYGKMKVLGSNITTKKARIDYASDVQLELEDVEEKLNSFLSEEHDIVRSPDKEKPDLKWWQCGEWKMPCGGTHVKNTKEIGRIELKRKKKGQGKERAEIYLSEN